MSLTNHSKRLVLGLLGSLILLPLSASVMMALSKQTALFSSSQQSDTLPRLSLSKDNHWGDPHTGQQSGTGSRNDCPDVEMPLTALLPATNVGKTVAESPTIWFYVPYTSHNIAYGEFVLQDNNGFDVVDPIQFTLPETSGFMSFTLPKLESPLQADVDYYWAFQLYCNAQNRTPIYVEGWIQPVQIDPNLSASLNTETEPVYEMYWENAIWFDAVNALAQQRLSQPTDSLLAAEWLELLRDGGLDAEALPETELVGPVLIDELMSANQPDL